MEYVGEAELQDCDMVRMSEGEVGSRAKTNRAKRIGKASAIEDTVWRWMWNCSSKTRTWWCSRRTST